MRMLDGRYRLDALHGTGGMAEVWRAHDAVLSRDVAVKLLVAELVDSPAARDRVHDEARAAAALAHPNITSVFDFGLTPGDDGQPLPYIVMELLDGETLTARLLRGHLPWRRAVGICADVAAALACAHAAEVIHRDVKPANIMLTTRGVKVVDFGIAAVAGQAGDSDPNQPFLGTLAYVAPERLLGQPAVPATDVYALGLILYRCLSDDFPWADRSSDGMIVNHCQRPPAPLPPIDGLPDGVDDLIARCLAKDPTDRPAATDVARILASAAGTRVVLPGDESIEMTPPGAAIGPADKSTPDTLAPSTTGEVRPVTPPAPTPPIPPIRYRTPRLLLVAAGTGIAAAAIVVAVIAWGLPTRQSDPANAAFPTTGPGPNGAHEAGAAISPRGTSGPGHSTTTARPSGAVGTAAPVGPPATADPMVETATADAPAPPVVTGEPVPSTDTPTNGAPDTGIGAACRVGYRVNDTGTKARIVYQNTGTTTFDTWTLEVVLTGDGTVQPPTRTYTHASSDPLTPTVRSGIRVSGTELDHYRLSSARINDIPCRLRTQTDDPPPD